MTVDFQRSFLIKINYCSTNAISLNIIGLSSDQYCIKDPSIFALLTANLKIPKLNGSIKTEKTAKGRIVGNNEIKLDPLRRAIRIPSNE